MTTPNNNSADKLVNLAVEMDEQLKKKSSEQRIVPLAKLKLDRVDELTEGEFSELNEASEALAFLEQVRMDLGQIGSTKATFKLTSGAADTEYSKDHAEPTTNSNRDLSASDELANSYFGRFQIIAPLGQGGFARVFRAFDPLLEREVALKIPRPHVLVSKESQSRFAREGKAAALLSHPSIVTVFESGSVGPVNFIASEYCPGNTLAKWFSDQQRCVDAQTAVKIVVKLADAAEHAHQRGVIHRDLKPDNILIKDGKQQVEQRVRITDFGLAKQLQTDDASMTMEGAVVGTPAYMSPEQARGGNGIGVSTDIFSLGVILYELLTGVTPFSKSTHLGTLKSIEQDTPSCPKRINKAIPKDVAAICLKCLNKSPADRYATSFDLSRDLTEWLGGRSVKARHATMIEKIWRWTKRKPILAAALLFSLSSLALGLTVSSWQWSLAKKQRDRAQTNVDLLHNTIEEVLDEYSSFDSEVLGDPKQRQIVDKMLIVHQQMLQTEADQLDVSPKMIKSYIQISDLYRRIAEYEKSAEVCDQATLFVEHAIENRTNDRNEFLLLGAQLIDESIHRDLANGQHASAVSSSQKCIDLMNSYESESEKRIGQEVWWNTYLNYGLAQNGIDDPESAMIAFEVSAEHAETMMANRPDSVTSQRCYASSLQYIGETSILIGRLNKGENFLKSALQQFELLQENSSNPNAYAVSIGTIMSRLGLLYSEQGNWELAEDNLLMAWEELNRVLDQSPGDIAAHKRLVYLLWATAELWRCKGEPEKERRVHEQGIVLADGVKYELMRFRHQMFFRSRHGELLCDGFGETQKAEQLFDEAIQIGEDAVVRFPQDYGIFRDLVLAYRLKAMIREEADEFEIADEMFASAQRHALSYLRERKESASAQLLAIHTAEANTRFLCRQQRFEAAKDELIRVANAVPELPNVLYSVSRWLCVVVDVHRKAGRPWAERQEIENLTFDLLESAIKSGFSEVNRLTDDIEWASVNSSPRFQASVDLIKAANATK